MYRGKIGGPRGPFSDKGSRHSGYSIIKSRGASKSSCCGAPIIPSQGGVKVLICQQCGGRISPKIIK